MTSCLDNVKELYLAYYQDPIREEILKLKKNERKKKDERKFTLRLFHLCYVNSKSRVSNGSKRIPRKIALTIFGDIFLWKTKRIYLGSRGGYQRAKTKKTRTWPITLDEKPNLVCSILMWEGVPNMKFSKQTLSSCQVPEG